MTQFETIVVTGTMGGGATPTGRRACAWCALSGSLAYDAAVVALRRVQPMIPWPSTAGTNPGWVLASLGDNFKVPDDSANTEHGYRSMYGRRRCRDFTIKWWPYPSCGVLNSADDDAERSAQALASKSLSRASRIENKPRVQRKSGGSSSLRKRAAR